MLIMMMSDGDDDDNDDGGDDDVVMVTYIRTYLFSHWDLNNGYWNTYLSPKHSLIVICVHFDCLIIKKECALRMWVYESGYMTKSCWWGLSASLSIHTITFL